MALSDSKLIALGKKYKGGKKLISDTETLCNKIRDKVLVELDRRGLRALDLDGIRIAKVQQTETYYDMAIAERILDEDVLELITVRVIGKNELLAAVESGKITQRQLNKISTVRDKSPYINVTIKEA